MVQIYFGVELVNSGDNSCVFCCVLFKIKSIFEADKCLLLWPFKDNSNFSRLKTSNLNFLF